MSERQRPAPRIERRVFQSGAGIPNNPDLPALILMGALDGPLRPAGVEALLRANGWRGTWTWSIFRFHHYHPNAFETLVVARGSGRVMLGGPSGETFQVVAGDVLALPPGTGHCLVNASPDFTVVGSYPPGQEDYETLRADDEAGESVIERIRGVKRPVTDPIFGASGPILEAWSGAPRPG